MSIPLKAEFDYYLAHQDELVEQYNKKVIVIKNDKILGAYDSDIEAVEETSKTEELGTFLVQRCELGASAYTAIFHSRAVFS